MKLPFRRNRHLHLAGTWADTPLAQLAASVIDCEMTGLHPRHGDRIVSIAAVRVRNSAVIATDSFDSLVNPGRSIPYESTLIHGIDDDAVRDAPRAQEAVTALRNFLGDVPLIGHQVSFDLAFLEPVVRRAHLAPLPPTLDTMVLSALLWPQRGILHGLDAVAERLDIEVHHRHTALGDATATAEVFVRMIPLLAAKNIATMGDAVTASRNTALSKQLDAMF